MKNFTFSLLPTLFSILFFTLNNSSEQENLTTSVEEVKTFDLFEVNQTLGLRSDELTGGVYLDVSKKQLAQIFTEKPKEMNIVLPTEEEDVTLNLRQMQILTDDFVGTVKSSDGSIRRFDYEQGTYYVGKLEGDEKSLVTLSVFRNEVIGILSFGNQNYNLGKMQQGSKDPDIPYVLYKERQLKNPPKYECKVPASESMGVDMELKGNPEDAQKLINVVKVYIECDFGMYKDNGNDVQQTMDKMTAIFAEVAALYANELILTQISEIVVWDSDDPYSNTTTRTALDQFGAQVGNSFNGDLAHLVSTEPWGGGVAWLDVLCANSRRHAVSGIRNNFASVPTFSWTVEVFTHEMGHNLGSPHTQACRWGSSGNQALDDCVATEGGCAPGPSPTNGGTIMSYCHQKASVGINFANGFGVEPGNLVRDRVANAACLEEVFDCLSKIVLEPGVTFRGTTADGGATEFVDYNCSSTPHRGPEIAHVFSANVPGWAYITYTENMPEQLDLFMASDCDANSCVKMWNGAPLVQDSFQVVPGEEYVFIVDVVEDNPGGEYTLRISFPNADCNTNATLEEGIIYPGNTVTNGTANIIDYSCSSERYLGNEFGHIYTATETGKVYIYYNEDLPQQMDLLLMDACDPTTCVKKWTGGRNIRDSIDVVAGQGYFFFVDVVEDHLGGPYNLLISAPGSGCATTVSLSNGETYTGNSADGAANFINYTCGGGAQSGNEVGHFFIHPEDARATVEFKDLSGAGFNLFMADACHPDSCIQMWSGDVIEDIDIIALRSYYFIVDKPDAAGDGDYELTVTIEPRQNTCFCFDPNADEICENFESYFGGDLSNQSPCWSMSQGSNDGLVDVGNAISGDNALKISDGRSVFFNLGNRTTGKYIFKFKQNVALGKEAYWRGLHIYDENDPSNNQVAFDVEQTVTNGTPFGKLYSGQPFSSIATFPYTNLGAFWIDFVLIIDLDGNTVELSYNDITYQTWDFSNTRNGTGGAPILAGIEFYSNGPDTDYLIDNIQFLDNASSFCERSGALYCDDFDDRSQGEIIANTQGFWDIMDIPSGASRANASTLNSTSGLFSCQVRAGVPGASWDDIVVDFEEFETGRIKKSFKFYIPKGSTGHFRTLHSYDQNDMLDESIASYVYLSRLGYGVVVSGNEQYPFLYTNDSWVEYVQIVDFDKDETSIFIEGASVATFPFSNTIAGTGTNKKWAGFNFSSFASITDAALEVNANTQDRFTWMFVDNVEMFDLDLYLGANPEAVYFDENGGSEVITVESNTDSWMPNEDVDWLTVAPASGANDGTFTITADPNPVIDGRGHDVVITGRGVAPQVVRVIQLGAIPFMDIDNPGPITVSPDPGSLDFMISSNVFWSVRSMDTSWLRVSTVPGGKDDGPFSVEYDLNIGAERTDTIIVEGQPAADILIIITQEAAGPTLVIQPDTICVDGRAGSADFDVLANVNWTVSNSNPWFSVDPSSGTEALTASITYDENPTTSDRYATFTVSGSGVADFPVVVKQTPIPAYLETDPLILNVGQPAGQVNLNVLSNVNWTATRNATWFTLDMSNQTSGSGPGTIMIDYEENIFPDDRIDTIYLSGDNGVADIAVLIRQEGAGRLLSATPINITLPPSAGDTTVDIFSNITWQAETFSGWFTINGTDDVSGSFDGTLNINYQQNQTTSSRTETIKISGGGVTDIIITITQEALGAFLCLTPEDTILTDAAGTFDFEVLSNLAWEITDDVSWMSTSTFNGTGATTITATYTENTSPFDRTATITLSSPTDPGIPAKTLTVTQNGKGFVFEADQDTICVGPALVQVPINITASNFAWSAVSDASWAIFSGGSSGFGNGTLNVGIFANDLGDTRYAHLTISATGGPDLNVVVKQTGNAPVLDASPTTINVGADAGSETFDVTGNVTWTVSSPDSWIHSFNPDTATGDSQVGFEYDANPTTNQRTGTIVVTGPAGTDPVTITVIQEGGAQTLTVDPATINVTAPEGDDSFAITASGDWTITSNNSWIHSMNPDSGSGDQNITFEYDENTDINSRTGTLTIELTGTGISETVTVVQEGASASLAVNPTSITLPAVQASPDKFDVTTNLSWTVTMPAADTWLRLNILSGTGDGEVSFNYDSNLSVNSRTTEITVSAAGVPDQVVTVTQEGAAVIFDVDDLTVNVTAPAGTTDIDLNSNVEWTVCRINDAWITGVTPDAGTDNATLEISYNENTAPTSRTGTFVICNSFNSTEITVTVIQSAAGVNFSVDKNQLLFAQPAGSDVFQITSNVDWEVESDESWISFDPDPTTGNGNREITVMVTANPDFTSRTGIIRITSPGQTTLEIEVIQEGLVRMISVDPTQITVGQPAGTESFNITSNSDWTVKTDATWINLSTSVGSGDAQVSFDYAENPDLQQRTAIIKVCVPGLADTEIEVTQAGRSGILSVDPNLINAAAAAGTGSFNITSNTDWTIKTTETWIFFNPNSGSGDATIDVSYLANPDMTARTGVITVCADNLPDQTVTISQAGAVAPELSATPTLINAVAGGESVNVDITSNISWTVMTDGSSWFRMTDMASGNGDETRTIVVDPNTGGARTGTITLKGDNVPDVVITISQAGVNFFLDANPTSINVTAPVGSESFAISSNVDWQVKSSTSWIEIPPDNTGNGDEPSFGFTYLENTDLNSRTGEITIEGLNGVPDVVITVTQAGLNAVLDATPMTINLPANSGSSGFDITANIGWDITASAGWLFNFSGLDGNGNAQITFDHDENNAPTTRTATITISGGGLEKVITVNQEAPATFMTVNPDRINLDAPAGSSSFDIMANIDWTISIPASATWLHYDGGDLTGNGNSTFNFTYDENTDASVRSTVATISGNGVPDRQVEINQQGTIAAYLNLDQGNLSFNNLSGSQIYNVSSNVSWTAESDVPWIQLVNESGTNDGFFVASWSANTTQSPRVGTITVMGAGVPDVVVTITQDPFTPELSADPLVFDVGSFQGRVNFTITSNVAWTINSDATWAEPVNAFGTNNQTVEVKYETNPNATFRTANLTISGPGVSDVTVIINQSESNDVRDLEELYKLSLYPNPVSDAFTVDFNLPVGENLTVDVLDMTGKVMDRLTDDFYTAGTNQLTHNVNQLSPGVYLLRFKSEKGVLTKRFVVSKY